MLAISPALAPFTCQLARDFPDAFGVNGFDGIATDITGNRLPNTPEWTVSAGAEYTFTLGGSWAITPRVDYYYQADSFARIFNGPNDTLDSYSLVNAAVRIEQDDGWYVNLFIKNATDEDVITDIYLTDQSSRACSPTCSCSSRAPTASAWAGAGRGRSSTGEALSLAGYSKFQTNAIVPSPCGEGTIPLGRNVLAAERWPMGPGSQPGSRLRSAS